MKQIALYSNLSKDTDLTVTKQLLSKLNKTGISVVLTGDFVDYEDYEYCPLQGIEDNVEALIVLGGDGTMLKVARAISHKNIPILGINLGKKGFVTTTEKDDLDEVVRCILEDDYDIQEDIVLSIRLCGETYYAVNDVVVGRSDNFDMIPTQVYVDDNFYYTYDADGVIISTPTGSTAYALSAGGPIISPGSQCMEIIGICQHSLYNRAVVVNDLHTVRLIPKGQHAKVYVDGELVKVLGVDEEVVVAKSDRSVKFIRFKNYNFYSKLMTKLSSTTY